MTTYRAGTIFSDNVDGRPTALPYRGCQTMRRWRKRLRRAKSDANMRFTLYINYYYYWCDPGSFTEKKLDSGGGGDQVARPLRERGPYPWSSSPSHPAQRRELCTRNSGNLEHINNVLDVYCQRVGFPFNKMWAAKKLKIIREKVLYFNMLASILERRILERRNS